jgi:hypothetical protein
MCGVHIWVSSSLVNWPGFRPAGFNNYWKILETRAASPKREGLTDGWFFRPPRPAAAKSYCPPLQKYS